MFIIWNMCSCQNYDYLLMYILQISWHDMKLKLTLGYCFINKGNLWFHQLGHLTFSKKVFWSVNCTLSLYQIFCFRTSSLKLAWKLKFQTISYTPESFSKKSHYITSFIDPIYQRVSSMYVSSWCYVRKFINTIY